MKRSIAIRILGSLALAGAGCPASGDDPTPITALQSVASSPQITHGPMLGDVRSQRARIWLRLDGAGEVKVRSRPAGGSWSAPSQGYATGSDNTLIVPLNGLTASTEYSYQLTTDDGASWTTAYKLKTAPPDTAPRRSGTFVDTFLRDNDKPTPQAHWTHGDSDNGWPNTGKRTRATSGSTSTAPRGRPRSRSGTSKAWCAQRTAATR